jgi:hypothetical protein
MSRVELEGSEALGEAPMPMSAQLHQQEAGPATQPPRRGRSHAGRLSGHTGDDTASLELFVL